MEIKQNIKGKDLYNHLWADGKDNFEELVDRYNTDPEELLFAVENLLNHGDLPTIEEINDLFAYDVKSIIDFLNIKDVETLAELSREFRKNQTKWTRAIEIELENNPNDENLQKALPVIDVIIEDIEETNADPDDKPDILDSELEILSNISVNKSLSQWVEDVKDWYNMYHW